MDSLFSIENILDSVINQIDIYFQNNNIQLNKYTLNEYLQYSGNVIHNYTGVSKSQINSAIKLYQDRYEKIE